MQTAEGSPCDLSTPLQASEYSTQSTTPYQPFDTEWDEESGKNTLPKNSFKEKFIKKLWWCVDPTHALAFWIFMTLETAVFTFAFAKMGWIGSDDEARLNIERGAKRMLYFIVVLKMLSLHPSRAVWLYQWAFKAEGDRAYFDEAFPFASKWPKLTWYMLVQAQISFCAQYFWWLATYIWAEGTEPTWATVLPLVLGLPGLVVGILQAVLKRMHLRKHANGADYENMKTFDELTAKTRELHQHHALPSEWRVTIRVERPGQAPLEFDTNGNTAMVLAQV